MDSGEKVHNGIAMFTCKFCNTELSTTLAFVRHAKLHKNAPNQAFACGVVDCPRSFRNFSAFKCHIYRDHKAYQRARTSPFQESASIICNLESCDYKCQDLKGLTVHLKQHLEEGRTVACPFKDCSKTFSVKSTFTSHMSRIHRHSSVCHLVSRTVPASECNTIDETVHAQASSQSFQIGSESEAGISDEVNSCGVQERVDETLFRKNLTLFYLKLQAKMLLPASVVQTIFEEFEDIHDLGQCHMFEKLSEKLKSLGISDDNVSRVIKELEKESLFKDCTSLLRTDQRRKTVFKNSFNYVAPLPVFLGLNESGKESFAQYVPIQETLRVLLHNESFRKQYEDVQCQGANSDVMQDIWDGEVMLKNTFFPSESPPLALILYEDALEVTNPLGAGRKKHKVLAVYLTLGNISPWYRSNIDHMQLVLLCKEQDFKTFGHDLVFGPLIRDLKDMEDNGIILEDGTVFRGGLCAIAGDNLGSHNIGGFVENFSRSEFFCRFCDISRAAFQSNALLTGVTRTRESYQETVQSLQRQRETSVKSSERGIKCDSIFNQLRCFHVCQPGLPPCLGHDLFEGVVSFDLALSINRLVQEKHFTNLDLNASIRQFKFLGNDALDKPPEIHPGSEKLSGHAVQNWCLLRVIPLLIGDKIQNPAETEVWQLVLLLRQIVDYICAPCITADQVAYLRVLIDEYLSFRAEAFPGIPLRPKHHYLCHYPELILKFGPLIRLWTLRFESKHTYFKQCARKLHNFKNLCSTLAERHQLLQAYLNAGSMFPPLINIHRGAEFHCDDYNADIQNAVSELTFSPRNTIVTNDVTVKGTQYRKGLYVVLGTDEDVLLVGEIKLALIRASEVYLVLRRRQAVLHMGVYLLDDLEQRSQFVCVRHEELLDYYPLPEYKVNGVSKLILHHSFPSS